MNFSSTRGGCCWLDPRSPFRRTKSLVTAVDVTTNLGSSLRGGDLIGAVEKPIQGPPLKLPHLVLGNWCSSGVTKRRCRSSQWRDHSLARAYLRVVYLRRRLEIGQDRAAEFQASGAFLEIFFLLWFGAGRENFRFPDRCFSSPN